MFAILAASLKASDLTYLPFVYSRVLWHFLVCLNVEHFFLVLTCLSQPALGYIPYGNGQFDGQGSGHDDGNNWHPSQGGVNSCDGERSHLACDVRRALASFLVSAPFPVVGVGLIEIPLLMNWFGLSFIRCFLCCRVTFGVIPAARFVEVASHMPFPLNAQLCLHVLLQYRQQ